jgi:integrase
VGRPRTKNHLPKYVKPIHGSLWYCAPAKEKGEKAPKPVRICRVGDDQALYKFMLEKAEPSGPVTYMNDLFDRYEREIIPTLGERTQKDYRKQIVKLREVFGALRPDDVRPKDVGELLVYGKGAAQSVKRVAVLSAVFSKAVGRWYICERNPCANIEKPPKGRRDRYVSDEEYQALYNIASPRLQVAMDLALLTGQRQGDLLSLTWDQVDTPKGKRDEWAIKFAPSKTLKKTGKRIRVRITPELEEVLKRAKMMVPTFPRRYVLRTGPREWVKDPGGKKYTSDGFRAVWQRAMRRAIREGVVKTRFTFHDLRAKNISDSHDIQEAMKRAGHNSMQMTRSVYDRGERVVEPLTRVRKQDDE